MYLFRECQIHVSYTMFTNASTGQSLVAYYESKYIKCNMKVFHTKYITSNGKQPKVFQCSDIDVVLFYIYF